MHNWEAALDDIHADTTPSPHYNTPNYTAIQHLVSSRYIGPYYGRRYFYNEQVKGDFINSGKLDSVDHEVMNDFYARDRNLPFLRYTKLDKDQQEFYKERQNYWRQRIFEFFPNLLKVDTQPLYKMQLSNPYFQRSLEDMRDAVWINNLNKLIVDNYFKESEMRQVIQALIHGDDSVFYTQDSNGNGFAASELYNKFNKGMDIPSVFELKKFSGKTPREQFLAAVDERWNINFYTVSQFANNLRTNASNINLLEADPREENESRRVRTLINEELINSTFRQHLKSITKDNQQLNLSEAEQLKTQVNEKFYLSSRKLRNDFIDRMQSVIAGQRNAKAH